MHALKERLYTASTAYSLPLPSRTAVLSHHDTVHPRLLLTAETRQVMRRMRDTSYGLSRQADNTRFQACRF
jgi:hypothetical protein